MPPLLPGEVRLRVSDLEVSARFYRDVIGLDLGYSEPHEPENEPHYEQIWGDYDTGQFFTLYAATEVHPRTSNAFVSFPTDDLSASHERLIAFGSPIVTPRRAVPWGTNAEYADPDGNIVSLTQHGG